MFIDNVKTYYTKDGEQRTTSGQFLCLLSCDDLPIGPDNFRGIIVATKLSQFGHWMMGSCKIEGHKLTLSGTYGEDGLTMTVPHDIFELGTPLPPELFEAWSKGRGWNDAGSEGLSIRQWAIDNMKVIKTKQRKGGKL